MSIETKLRERPILFSGPMVRAILDGKKTQTRRLVKPQFDGKETFGAYDIYGTSGRCCPYGKPGDRLWVRETWAHARMPSEDILVFRATSPDDRFNYACPQEGTIAQYKIDKWRPAIHMPRLASRINLEITDVRVERLQEISEVDIRSEGVYANLLDELKISGNSLKECWGKLWDSINGPGSWDQNSWVWVVEFRRVS